MLDAGYDDVAARQDVDLLARALGASFHPAEIISALHHVLLLRLALPHQLAQFCLFFNKRIINIIRIKRIKIFKIEKNEGSE
jgi:hypothetical protein